MEKYHNKVIQFGEDITKYLPHRINLVKENEDGITIDKMIEKVRTQDTVMFLANDVREITENWEYKLVLIGVLRDGSKAAVIIEKIRLYFDIRVPDGANASILTKTIKKTLEESDRSTVPKRTEIVYQFPFGEFSLEPIPYIRCYYNTTGVRKRAISYICNNEIEVIKDKVTYMRLETANCDVSNYYRKFAREAKINISSWNEIKFDIKKIRKDQMARNSGRGVFKKNWTEPIKYVFRIGPNDITAVSPDVLQKKEYKDMLFDKTIVMGWDLETYSKNSTGNAPLPEILDDLIFMGSATFHWKYKSEAMLKVCITDLPCPPREDCMIIQVKDQKELLIALALLIEGMAPDYAFGFNDSTYDWPFVIHRVNMYGLHEYWKEKTSVLRYTDSSSKYVIKGAKDEKVKMEADAQKNILIWDVPGFICLDARICFRKIYPKAEKTSLNYFLDKHNLGSKEDMPYRTMFRIYRLIRQLRKDGIDLNYDDLMDYLKSLDPDDKPYKDIRNIGESTYDIENLTNEDIIKLLGGEKEGGAPNEGITQVVHYCNIDAAKCQELMLLRRVIDDYREVAMSCYVSEYDSAYRGVGIKVLNEIVAEAIKPGWNFALNMQYKYKDERKYPGAYVVTPKKGLYRDTIAMKKARRLGIDMDKANPENGPVDENLLIPDELNEYINIGPTTQYKRTPLDENNSSDRPCSGLDFSSLYPSLIMAYNISPETTITNETDMLKLQNQGFELLYTEFTYAEEGTENKELIKCWVVQHQHPTSRKIKNYVKDLKSEFGPDWFDHCDEEFMKECNNEFKNTTLEQWKEYGMGLFPYVLKQQFDHRKSLKGDEEYYHSPLEVLNSVYVGVKSDEVAEILNIEIDADLSGQELINSLSEEQQYEYLITKLDIQKQEAIAKYEEEPTGDNEYNIKVIDKVINYIETSWEENPLLKKLYDYTSLWYNYFNLKQLAVKLIMNSTYGVAGQDVNPLFKVHVAGSVTNRGQYNTRMVKNYVEKIGFKVNYGDTDSLYIVSPEYNFEELDAKYYNGDISKLEYWTQMVEITMKAMSWIGNKVNNLLMMDNGSPFLRMAYEEVLYPYVLTGKKKYIGIAHERVIDFSACKPGTTLEDFKKSKNLFVRGLDLIRRGTSGITKEITYSIFWQAFNMEETRSFKEIILGEIDKSAKRNWNIKDCTKTAKYKTLSQSDLEEKARLEKQGLKFKGGNKAVLSFIDRMKKVIKEHPELGMQLPEVGDRFEYFISRKNPITYDIRGRKRKLGKGELYEFITSWDNKDYQNIYGKLEIDIDSYMEQVLGQLARFIIYHPDYDPYYEEGMSDKEYKEADGKAFSYAKKLLNEYYKNKFGYKYKDYGSSYKKIFSYASKTQQSIIEEEIGGAANILELTRTVNTSAEVSITSNLVQKKIFNTLIKSADKLSDKLISVIDIKSLLDKLGIDIYKFEYRLFKKENSLFKRKIDSIRTQKTEIENCLRDIIPKFQNSYVNYNEHLNKVIETYKQMDDDLDPDNIDEGLIYYLMEEDIHDFEFNELEEMYEIYVDLVTVLTKFKNIKHTRLLMGKIMSESNGNKTTDILCEDKTQEDKFRKFLLRMGKK